MKASAPHQGGTVLDEDQHRRVLATPAYLRG
jgi:hypothetical protein